MKTYTRKKLQVQEIKDVHSLCRLCLGKTEEMISIFDPNADGVFSSLSMRIGMCLGLEVSREDTFPKLICPLCNSELDKFYTFKKNCTMTYRKLKATLFPVKKTDRKKEKDEYDEEIPTNVISSNGENSTEKVIIDLPQNLEENSMPLELKENTFLLGEEENLNYEIVTVDENEKNNLVIELNTETKDCHVSLVSDALTEDCLNIQTANVKVEQGFGNGNQLANVVPSHDVGKGQEDERIEMSDKLKSTECLPALIVSNLIEEGVLAKRDDNLEIVDYGVKTFNLETACGTEIIMELVEEDPSVAVDGCNKLSRSKIFGSNLKNDALCCGACGARLASRSALVRHLRVHSGEKPFACRACGRRFAQREVLRRHQLVHSDKLPYQCARCPKAYTQRGALEAHARSHAPPAARPLVLHRCSRCPKVFLYPSGLSRHMSVHQGRDYPCDECSRTFNDKSSLQRHRRGHQRRAR